ncbi:sulfurtransferase TusA family protein [Oryzobacter terrae]|uniref:sulfurtransferase TusA family protein n=1 Tax=Oryzobacter terrae TaxID=1620385 RepID=UPI00367098CF
MSDAAPVVDARGTRCPVPVIRVARAVRDLPPGSEVVLLADDVAARSDVPAWGRLRGHDVAVGEVDAAGTTTYVVVTGWAPGGGGSGEGRDEKST